MGQLRLRITLNHHNSKRPLYSASTKIPNQVVPANTVNKASYTLIEKSITLNNKVRAHEMTREQSSKQKLILGLDFIELIIKKRKALTEVKHGLTQRFYLKYRLLN